MTNEVSVWNKVMATAMDIPGVKVDREAFLTKELRPYCTKDELEKAIKNPVGVISQERIDTLANACIRNQTAKVTAISAAAGVPGGLAMVATIPADMAQYYWHTFVLAQKLAYLYGIPDLRDEDGNLTETSQDMLTLFVGVMMGAAAANNAIKNVSKAFAVQVAKRLPQKALTKTVYYPIIKQVAKWIGVNLTKASFAKGVGKAIPVVGGVISGGLTLATFRPAAKRLQKKLREQMYDIKADVDNATTETLKEDVDYEDVTEEASSIANPQAAIIRFIINLSNISGKRNEAQTNLISEEIEHSTLNDDEKLALAQELESGKQVDVDLSLLQGDDASAALLLEKGAEVLKAAEKISLAEKLYFKKVARQLGFATEDIEEALKE